VSHKRLRVPVRALSEGTRTLDEDTARYVIAVHRRQVGDELWLFDGAAQQEADAKIVSASPLQVEIGPLRPASKVAPRDITWIHALPKGDKSDAIVQDATELGATAIQFVHSARSVVKLDEERAASRVARWEKIATEAARQCGRGDVPAILPVTSWEEALSKAWGAKFCLYEDSELRIGAAAFSADRLVFAVGPEGGLDPSEVEIARAQGFAIVNLGELILRTETVCAAVLGAALLASG